ncbi:VOC family protein [Haloechinothrix sp. YIM 98757]|uniref:VOC family protein n=1 Tax=Haloechinothrix aidingensis TaxID=2752311 RepID=A0A838A661_9PSEU|nr:VOC family protein [Haloechinothrix aidingensis]MBA0124578.1 VOC family protein [Haloechinothrix aidingensis]
MSAAVRFECVALDCPDPYELASFYAGVLGWEIHSDSEPDDSWVTLSNPDGGADICFQLDPAYQAPTWPSNERAQMLHLDFEVADIAAEHERVLALGARLLDDRPERFRVYADPAGHPFCLVW